MKNFSRYIYSLSTIILVVFACQKVDYTADINLLKNQITQINARLDSLTNAIKLVSNQLTNLESSVKSKIDNANNRIDSISGAFTVYKTNTSKSISDITSSIATLTNDIKTINTLVTKNNTDITKKTDSIITKIDSSFRNIRVIDSALKIAGTNTDTLAAKTIVLNKNYNDILSNYLELLKIVRSANSIYLITGKIEKGPFSKGSIISFYELDSNLSQNGKSFSTTIDDNEGNYDLKASGIGGKMLRVQTDGFYFNEVLNNLSASRIILTGISKVDSSEKVNVNVLTHIERRRVQYLISERGYAFDSAKRQAVSELLSIFNTKDSTIKRSEKISLFNDNNDVLLNISILLQGYRTDAQLSEILTDFSNDFYKDGIVDDLSIKKRIYNHGFFIDTNSVTDNIKNAFKYTPKTYSVLKNYLESNIKVEDESFMPIIYPSVYNNKKNFLTRIKSDTISSGLDGCLIYQKNGIPSFDFKVTIRSVFPTNNSGFDSENVWFYGMGSGWSVTNFQFDNFGNQTFYTNNPISEVSIGFRKGKYTLDFYEPSTSKYPTFTKTLVVR